MHSNDNFTLFFSEGYSPLWEAKAIQKGNTTTYKSIPLYGAFNGFIIDKKGKYDIIIQYKPQTWFMQGLAISGTTFLGCLGFLFYDWCRRRRDEWAVRLSDRWRGLLN